MLTVHRTPAVALTSRQFGELDCDLLVVPVFEDDDLADVPDLIGATGGELGRARESGEFRGKAYEVFVTTAAAGWKARRVAIVGAGPRKSCTTDTLRRIAATGGLAARQRRLTRMAVALRPVSNVSSADGAQVMAEGAIMANFDGASTKRRNHRECGWSRSSCASTAPLRSTPHSSGGRVIGECTNLARELANEPGNELTPRIFADRAVELARRAG
jgi:leucyl aminopeptidase